MVDTGFACADGISKLKIATGPYAQHSTGSPGLPYYKALQPTANPLCGLSLAELGR